MADADNSSEGTSVYTYFDEHGVLLYVGITKRRTQRQTEHNGSKAWWKYVVRQEVDHYPTRERAARVEKALIKEFRPPFNIQHNPDHEALREAYTGFRSKATNSVVEMLTADRVARLINMNAQGFQNSVKLTSIPADERLVSMVDLNFPVERIHTVTGGRKGYVRSIERPGGVLTVWVNCSQGLRVASGQLMFRYPESDKKRIQIKKVELFFRSVDP